jgi:hypothetical protein
MLITSREKLQYLFLDTETDSGRYIHRAEKTPRANVMVALQG